ncbi:hypothetical protein Fmac_032547 [Flemingia macrophylla]|uniref:Uncharacterized protein n=1 Tax=Flemingia macrophylla TaxID=520843 RepID=A0ABD1L574_9FABA
MTKVEPYTISEIEALLMHQEERLEKRKNCEATLFQANISQNQCYKKGYTLNT